MQLLTVREVAGMLCLSKSKVYDLKEKIGHYKVGGCVRFAEEDVLRFLDGCRVNTERRPRPRFRSRHFA